MIHSSYPEVPREGGRVGPDYNMLLFQVVNVTGEFGVLTQEYLLRSH